MCDSFFLTDKLTDNFFRCADDVMDTYATVFVGYPIWWYTAPRIVNTFLESYDFSEKAVMLFATSGTSGIDKSVDDLRHTYASINFVSGRLLNGSPSVQDLEKWAKGLTG